MGVKEAQKAVDQAELAYSANKGDKALKKAWKAAKAELAAQTLVETAIAGEKRSKKRKAETGAEKTPEEIKLRKEKKARRAHRREEERKGAVTLNTLQTTYTDAKAVFKADKTIENRQKMKDAKAPFKAALVSHLASIAPSASAPPPSAGDLDVLSGLKSNKPFTNEEKDSGESENAPCNRVFVGNLSYNVDDEKIKEFFEDCGPITKITWIEDKRTQKFKGCGVLDFDSVESATKALAKNQQVFMERPIAVHFSKLLLTTGRASMDEKQKKFVDLPLTTANAAGCLTCFLGNLSFNIEESDVLNLAKDCGVEALKVRWLMHKDTGNFKGCGFVDFATTEDVEKFIAKRGAILAGRPVRIDYAGAPPTRK